MVGANPPCVLCKKGQPKLQEVVHHLIHYESEMRETNLMLELSLSIKTESREKQLASHCQVQKYIYLLY